ncbi:MAG: hypothetical protein FWC89_12865 [Defluviitaleaceae bacterium]|nr:hypothetical protein [Defluviitaleaceae bacterium]
MPDFSPMNAAELMDKVLDVYKKSFWMQIAFAAIIMVVGFVAIFVVVFVLTFALIFGLGIGVVADAGEWYYIAMILGMGLLLLPLFLLWQAFSSSGHILLSRQAFYGHKVRLGHMGLTRVLLRVATSLLAQIILMIPFILVSVAVLYALFIIASEFLLVHEWQFLVFTFFVIFLLSFLYLVYSHVFSLAIPVAVLEQKHFFATITRSFQLIRPDFWRVFGIRAIWFLVVFAFSSTAQGVFMILNMGIEWLANTAGMGWMALMMITGSLSWLITIAVSLLSAPLEHIMMALLYFNQRMKNEGLDLEIKLEKLSIGQGGI